MSRPPHRLSNVELAMLYEMGRKPDFMEFDPNVDTAVPDEIKEAYRQDSKRYFPKLLASRARLYRQEKLGLGEKSIKEQFWHATVVATVVLLVFAVVAFAAGFAIASGFFDAEKSTASILAIFWLVALTALPVVFPVFSLIFLVIHKLQDRKRTGLATIVITSFRTLRRIWCKLAMRVGLIDEADRNAITTLEEVVQSHSYFGSAGAVFITNLYFLVVALVIWGSVYFQLSTRPIDFFYQDSISQIENRKSKIQLAAVPVHWLTPIPSEAAIAWAAKPKGSNSAGPLSESNRTEKEAAESLSARMTQGFRVEWSNFLLGLVFIYVFVPRLVVAVVSFAITYYFRRDFVPKLTDKDYRKIVANILDPPITTETVDPTADLESISQDSPTSPIGTPRDDVKGMTESPVVEPKSNTSKPDMAVISSGSFARLAEIVAVGGDPNLPHVVTNLALSDDTLANGGVLQSARDRGEFKKGLAEKNGSGLVFVFSLLDVPGQNLVDFLKSVVTLICDNPAAGIIDVVLSNGSQARERLDDDLKLFQNRVDQWRNACVQCGISPERIHDVDLSTSAGIATCRSLIAGSPSASTREPVRRMAGKYTDVVSWLRKELPRMFDDSSASTSGDDFAMAALDEIDAIYEEERIEFHRFIDAESCSDSLRQAVNKVELPQGVLREQLEQFAKVSELMNSLSPRWIGAGAIAGASLCLGGSVALALSAPAVAPVLAPFVVGSATLAAVTGGGVGQWLSTKIAPGEESHDADDVAGCLQINTKSILQMVILKTLILELQGSSEQFITNQIGKQTEQLGELATVGQSEVDDVLLAFQCNLDELRGTIK